MKTNEPYGYVIEITSTVKISVNEYSFTELYWNRKIYKTLKIAEDALNNIKKTENICGTYKYKILPLYRKEEICKN